MRCGPSSDGSTYEVPDPGPTRFLLAPGSSAWFVVGTVTAHGGSLRRLTYMSVYPTVRTGVSVGVPCKVDLATDSAAGAPVPVSVTAFAPGRAPHA